MGRLLVIVLFGVVGYFLGGKLFEIVERVLKEVQEQQRRTKWYYRLWDALKEFIRQNTWVRKLIGPVITLIMGVIGDIIYDKFISGYLDSIW